MSSAAEPYPITLRTSHDAETTRLFEAYADRMLAYCTRRLRSRSDAEDAVQTIFLYAMRALRRGVEPECESAWLHTIAKNVCNWQQRTACRRPVVSDVEIEALACAQRDEDVELLSGLRDALGSLPPQQQRALVLREWHGVPPREIAVELGLTAPQTHALLTRARRSLAQALTAPKRAALALGGLAFTFRARLEALAGGGADQGRDDRLDRRRRERRRHGCGGRGRRGDGARRAGGAGRRDRRGVRRRRRRPCRRRSDRRPRARGLPRRDRRRLPRATCLLLLLPVLRRPTLLPGRSPRARRAVARRFRSTCLPRRG